jgi:hypothetical protein
MLTLKLTVSRLGVVLALISIACLILPGPAHRLWGLETKSALLWFTSSCVFGVLGIVLGGMALAIPRISSSLAFLAIALSAFSLSIDLYWKRLEQIHPKIHDISTDTKSPPPFSHLLGPDYEGPQIAEKQHLAYPDLRPLIVSSDFRVTFDAAVSLARSMGWDVVAAEPQTGRIEAIHTTLWFGFKNDIVVRLSLVPDGTRVDVRSVSRELEGDLGSNASLIRAYLKKLHGKVGHWVVTP